MKKHQIKDRMLSQFIDTYANLLRCFRIASSLGKSISSALILPAAATGSLGDEAMLVAAINCLSKQGVKRIGVISYSTNREWDHLDCVSETVNLKAFFKGKSKKTVLYFISKIFFYDQFYCIGADVLDGFYSENRTLQRIRLVSLAAQTGAESSIVSFSFNPKPTPVSVTALSNLPASVRLCSRDPVSCERLQHALSRPVELSADLAFLLQPTPNSKISVEVSKWASTQRASDRIIIGINANSLMGSDQISFSSDKLVRVYTDALSQAFSEDSSLSFLMIPHDFRGKNSDKEILEHLLDSLPEKIKLYCFQVPTPCTAADVKAICSEMDLVLTGRMHLAIAALGQKVPVACITYQGKFEGLLNGHFELSEVCISPEIAFQPGQLANFLKTQILKREETHRQIQEKLSKVRELASINFLSARSNT